MEDLGLYRMEVVGEFNMGGYFLPRIIIIMHKLGECCWYVLLGNVECVACGNQL